MSDSKEHILKTSLLLFLQKGYKEVTMKEIVEISGMSKGAFYHYFDSKEGLFKEVIQHFFTPFISTDYSKFSQDSLKVFFTDIIKEYRKKRESVNKLLGYDINNNLNYENKFYILFDALRILPDFKKDYIKKQKEEKLCWIKVIKNAKKNKEIKSDITDEQIAKLFIFISDGTALNFITKNYQLVNLDCVFLEKEDLEKEDLYNLWNDFYNCIKI